MTSLNSYFARMNGEQLAKALTDKIDNFEKYLDSTGRLHLIQTSYEHFYNLKLGSTLTKAGNSGEILKISVNNYRSFVNNIHVLIANTKPHFKSEASSADYEAQSECLLADAILDHYLADGELEPQIIQAVLDALIYGECFLEVDWAEEDGTEIAIDPETQQPVYSGNIRTKLHNSLNVIRDTNLRNGDDLPWVIVRSFEDKWQLAAQYPEHEDHILSVTSNADRRWTDTVYSKIRGLTGQDSDSIAVYRFYHATKKGVLPQGKEALMINGRIVEELPLTAHYRSLPVKRLAAMAMEGSFLPYSQAWDLLPLMQATNALMTAAVSNATNLALTSLWIQSGSGQNFSMKTLAGGFTLLESASPPQPLNLASNSPEIWNTLGQLQQQAQLLTGLNSVARGDLQAASQLKSGTALATMLAQSVQVQSMLQQRWRKFSEEVANLVLEVLQVNAKSPLLISIAGQNQRAYIRAFSRDSIASVKKVRAELQNPVLSTQAGKLEIANNLLQQFPQMMDPTKYINVLTTGRLEGMVSPTFDQNMALLAESEAIREGKPVKPLLLERHDLFIKENLKLISTPEAKEDDGLVDRINEIVMQRLDLWEQLDADAQLASLVGIPPLQQPAPPPADATTAPSEPLAEPNMNVADPSGLPPEADPALQAAYDQALPQ